MKAFLAAAALCSFVMMSVPFFCFACGPQVVQWACGRRRLVASSSSEEDTRDNENSGSSDDMATGEGLTRMKLWAAPAVT
jgi:hypothetical protein